MEWKDCKVVLNTEEIDLFFELYSLEKEFKKQKVVLSFDKCLNTKHLNEIKDEEGLRDLHYKMEKYIDLKKKLNLFYGYKFTQIEEILNTVDELMSVDLDE